MKCGWCTEALRGRVFKLTAMHVDPLKHEVIPTYSTGEFVFSRIVCANCEENVVEEVMQVVVDEPPRMVEGGDVTYTCLGCASDILDGELMVQIKEGLLNTTDEKTLDPISVEVQGALCLRCAHTIGTQVDDDDLRDIRALRCCNICTEAACWREGVCRCSCHGNQEESEEEDYESATDASYFDVLPF